MFFFRHPKPVGDNRAVAVKVVEHNMTEEFNSKVILVNTKAQNENKIVPVKVKAGATDNGDAI